MGRESLVKFSKMAKPYLAVIFLQFGYAGLAIVVKFALNEGMSPYTYSVYRNLFAAVAVAPFAIFFERKVRPKMTISTFLKIMVLGLIGPVMQLDLFYSGMQYTTATFTASLYNVLPAITFVLAWILRIEKVNVKKVHSQAKVLGTAVTIGGAMIMTLVKGPNIGLPWTKHTNLIQTATALHSQQDIMKGAVMIIAACFLWASFIILQGITLKSYPAGLSLTTLICTAGALQGSVVALVAERKNLAAWALHWNTKLLAMVYSGVICSGVTYYLSGIIIKEKGPVFVTAFNPLSTIIAAIMGTFILADQLSLGIALGAVAIMVGLYMVIWGKKHDNVPPESTAGSRVVPVDELPSTLVKPATNQEPSDTTTTVVAGDEAV
ncbi:PREDICTED: WAT1-related protein At2g39510-like [Ipomoea nil]|uniref:WAT1-related protein At2g39510-like n=1 Tax=Ipomoea nil TaxID=35883 RepID=UPI000901BF98|nr:PREDICTED: WAT1-related protein At2g39510-like [Ipomoea nil]